MIGILLSLCVALFDSFKGLMSKKFLQELDAYVLAWGLYFVMVILLLPVLFFIEIPEIGSKFLLALIVSGGINVITTILYMKAIKCSDLSLCAPITAFTPLFLLITAPLINREFPKTVGIIGVILIVIGTYVLNLKDKKEGLLMPIKGLFKEKGVRYMFVVAFLWSISSSFDKIGVQNSSPLIWSLTVALFVMIILFPIMLFKSKNSLAVISPNMKKFFVVGIIYTLTTVTQMVAISMTLVAYVISIKRTSAVLSVVWGRLIFKENGFKDRLLGAVIMVVGVIMIVLS